MPNRIRVRGRRSAAAFVFLVACGVAAAEPIRIRDIPALGGERAYQWFGDGNPDHPAAPGNGNGHAEAGERVALGFQLLNLGREAVSGVQAKLAARDASIPLEWIRASITYGELPPVQEGASAVAAPLPPIAFRIPAGFAAPGRIPFVLTLEADGRVLVTREFELPVQAAPALELTARCEGEAAPGAPGRVTATARLVSGAALERVRFCVELDRPALLHSPWERSVGRLESGQEASAEFAVRPAAGIRAGALPLRVVLRGSASNVPYRWTYALPCSVAAATPRLRHPGAVVAHVASVLVEEDGVPLTLPQGEPVKGPFVETAVTFPEGRVAVEVRHVDPRTTCLSIAVKLDGASIKPGSEVEFAPGARLEFTWDVKPTVVFGAWVRIRPDRVVFEVMPAPVGMVFFPEGDVRLGRDGGLPEYGPEHTVTLPAFAIDAYEVTNEQYGFFLRHGVRDHARCCPEEPASKDHTPLGWSEELPRARPNVPVVGVDWFDAMAYAAWTQKRLPTEAEWERAARGATPGAPPGEPKFPWGADEEFWNRCNTGRIYPGPLPVGTFASGRTPDGVYDLAGNAAEWCADWYAGDAHGTGKAVDPTGPEAGKLRVLRGGSWDGYVLEAHTFARRSADPRLRRPDIGFRCAYDP